MKKIIVMALVAVVGVVANAATVKWSASGVMAEDGVTKAGSSYTAYVYCLSDSSGTLATTTVDAAVAGIGNKDVSGSLGNKSFTSGMFAAQTVGTVAVGGNPETVSLFAIVANSDFSKYFVLDSTTVTLDVDSGTYTAKWTAVNNTADSWKSSGSVPEPTTGLLVLLGMAGLALKRKVA